MGGKLYPMTQVLKINAISAFTVGGENVPQREFYYI